MEKTFNASETEARINSKWEEAGAFEAGANAKPGSDTYCIMIPPPNVTGSLHMGHAFNNTIQDILIRWHRMRGFDVLWQPGQDHAGIATQMVVERMLAETGQPSRSELGREEFLSKVWEWKEQSGGAIINQLKRLGASCDWSRNRFTMDDGFHDAVLKVFVDLYNKGLIYRGKRLVNWDPHFRSAISDLEVEQIEVDGSLWHFRYGLEGGASYEHPIAVNDDDSVEWETRDYLVVATTRPETMLGDTAVAVHPDDARYESLVGKSVRLPLAGRSIPIVADEYADPEKGTGAVKITPAHDFNDWSVGRRAGLPAINVMDSKASMFLEGNEEFLAGCDPDAEAMRLHGMDRYEARERIVELAESQGWLAGIQDDRHMVPHGDRSKVAIEPYLTDQWFVDAAKIVKPAIEAVSTGRTRILPEQYSGTYFRWLENIEPWCISRQLWWGHQIPVWYDEDGNQYCAPSEDEAIALSGGKRLVRDPDVLDTWFSSGLWPIGTLGWPNDTAELRKYFPTDVLVTGFDIIFFWVARMMMMQLSVVGDIPFHTVYVHALVLDSKGKKMSKSLGNVIDPLELIERYGADSVRFTLASMAAMGRDLRLSEQRVAGYRNFATKIWNAARFAWMNGCARDADFDPASVRHEVNKWAAGEAARTLESANAALESYRFNDAANCLYAFVWGTVCDWYVEFAKPLIASEDRPIAEETKACMSWMIDQCLIMLHPFMPFVTEELWQQISPRGNILAHQDWPEYSASKLEDRTASKEIGWVIALIEEIRSVRAQMRVPAGAVIPIHCATLASERKDAYQRSDPLIRRLARVGNLEYSATDPKDSITVAVQGSVFNLALSGIVDIAAERSRLQKSRDRIQNEINALNGRLANPKFVSSAPEEVVETTREKLAEKNGEAGIIDKAIERLAGAAR